MSQCVLHSKRLEIIKMNENRETEGATLEGVGPTGSKLTIAEMPLREELLLSYCFTCCLLPSEMEKAGSRTVKEKWHWQHLLHAQVRSAALCVI